MNKYTFFGRIAKLLIMFDPAVVAGLRSSPFPEDEDTSIGGYMSEVLAALGAAQKIANVDEKQETKDNEKHIDHFEHP